MIHALAVSGGKDSTALSPRPAEVEPRGLTVLSYGGGRQTVAICVLIARGLLPKPDRIVMADTGRENPKTWEYLERHTRPLLAGVGLEVEVAPHALACYDLHDKHGLPLMPFFTADGGKLRSFCSGNWKRDVVDRYLRREHGIHGGVKWIGFALDERTRVQRLARTEHAKGWEFRFPLNEMMLTTADGLALVRAYGLPEPPTSSCWMCPHHMNAEWARIRDEQPDLWERACVMDEEEREEDIARGGAASGFTSPGCRSGMPTCRPPSRRP